MRCAAVLLWLLLCRAALALLVAPDSELTLRTTSSVDIQVCVANLLTSDIPAVEALVVATLQVSLQRTTAVYPVRRSTTPAGTVCWVLVYQAASPVAAGLAEQLILGPGPFTVNFNGQILPCTVDIQPWRGESAPLPLWDLSAQDIIIYGGVAGAAIAACWVAVCCFVALSYSQDERHAQAIFNADRRMLQRLAQSSAKAKAQTSA